MSEITLSLLHPTQGVPVQKWTFKNASVIGIGRAPDNDVVLASEVVSRHHAELRRRGAEWELIGLGSNGTFVEGEPRQQAVLSDGQRITLASSGLVLRFQIGSVEADPGATTVYRPTPELRIEIDQSQRARQVEEIAGTEYFERLRRQAAEIRNQK